MSFLLNIMEFNWQIFSVVSIQKIRHQIRIGDDDGSALHLNRLYRQANRSARHLYSFGNRLHRNQGDSQVSRRQIA